MQTCNANTSDCTFKVILDYNVKLYERCRAWFIKRCYVFMCQYRKTFCLPIHDTYPSRANRSQPTNWWCYCYQKKLNFKFWALTFTISTLHSSKKPDIKLSCYICNCTLNKSVVGIKSLGSRVKFWTSCSDSFLLPQSFIRFFLPFSPLSLPIPAPCKQKLEKPQSLCSDSPGCLTKWQVRHLPSPWKYLGSAYLPVCSVHSLGLEWFH